MALTENPITTPQPEASNRAERRHPNKPRTIAEAARYFHVSPKTVASWIGRGLIIGYRRGSATLVDLDGIEAGFKAHPKSMRDGRRNRFGKYAVIEPLPWVAEVVTEPGTVDQ